MSNQSHERGFTLIEALAVFAVVALVCFLLLPPLMPSSPVRAWRIVCVNDLKQVGYGFRVWQVDNQERFPMEVSVTNGGTLELISGPNAYRHFQVMSNELNTPKILFCPMDTKRFMATTFETSAGAGSISFSGNSNLSYFVALDATSNNATMFLSGDRNIYNGSAVSNGMLQLTTNRQTSWTREMHNNSGTILYTDGSVLTHSTASLPAAVANTGVPVTRLTLP